MLIRVECFIPKQILFFMGIGNAEVLSLIASEAIFGSF